MKFPPKCKASLAGDAEAAGVTVSRDGVPGPCRDDHHPPAVPEGGYRLEGIASAAASVVRTMAEA